MRNRSASWWLALLLAAGCGGRGASGERHAAPVPGAAPASVLADSAPDVSLPPVRLGRERGQSLVLLSVSPPSAPPPPAEAAPAEPPAPAGADERLPADGRLRPPVPRGGALPAPLPGARGAVELDVRIDETGAVSDAQWAAGDTSAATVRAAQAAARAMRFFPARLAGKAVAVWTRQRFEAGR